MSAPVITIENYVTGEELSVWNVGAVKAGKKSDPLKLRIWNNKANATNISDLRGCTITTLDVGGGSSSDVVAGRWVKVNIPQIDGKDYYSDETAPYAPIGGEQSRSLRADGLEETDGNVIKGTTTDAPSDPTKFCTIVLFVEVEANAIPGTKNWKTRINGYYV